MSTKTIKEWLETLDEPYRSQALENTDEHVMYATAETASIAIAKAFVWSASKQGVGYWLDVSHRLLGRNLINEK